MANEVTMYDPLNESVVVYHLGASIKYLGKKWFAFNRMEMPTAELLNKI